MVRSRRAYPLTPQMAETVVREALNQVERHHNDDGHDVKEITVRTGTMSYWALAEILREAAERLEHIEESGFEHDEAETAVVKSILGSLGLVEAVAGLLKQRQAVLAVRKKNLSRVQTSELIGVHQATVARWVKEAEAHEAATSDFLSRRVAAHQMVNEKWDAG